MIPNKMAREAMEKQIRVRFERLSPQLDERARRLFAATEAIALGYGGIAIVARATGMARRTIGSGVREAHALENAPPTEGRPRIRRKGGGRKKAWFTDRTLVPDLERLI